ncbi:putative lipid II flippase MurJ OS=Rhodanobacter lindaniclasticus OX=75310 GN=murJ PE=3 SV=1 [Rhodanobacter lindaniclasticus]
MKSPGVLRAALVQQHDDGFAGAGPGTRHVDRRRIGATGATDAFWVAFRIPNFMRRLFAEGSFFTAFGAGLHEEKMKEKGTHAQLKELMARVSGTLGGVLLLITALGMISRRRVACCSRPARSTSRRSSASPSTCCG